MYSAARSFLPELGALAANSPFLDAHDTRLASSRRSSNDAFHRTGVPPAFATWPGLAAYVRGPPRRPVPPTRPTSGGSSVRTRDHGTLEFRVADTHTRLEDSFAVAACCQALVAWLAELYDLAGPLPSQETFRIEENAWRAMALRRPGLDGRPRHGRADADTRPDRCAARRDRALRSAAGRGSRNPHRPCASTRQRRRAPACRRVCPRHGGAHSLARPGDGGLEPKTSSCSARNPVCVRGSRSAER